MAQDEHSSHGGVQFYFFIALVLGVITYIEFAIIEFDIAWLSDGWTLFWLVALSLLKFALVVAIYMHLRSDDPLYTGFFGSGMVIALGTFIALSLLFTVRSVNISRNDVMTTAGGVEASQVPHGEASEDLAEEDHGEEDHGGHGGVPEETLAMVESNGYSRPLSVIMDTPPPKGQELSLRLPEAPEPSYTLLASATAAAGTAAEARSAGTDDSASEESDTGSEAALAEASDSEVSQENAEAEASSAEANQEETTENSESVTTAGDFDWQTLGQETYASCVGCHQPNGQGVPSAFPPLAGHMPTLYNVEGGREYIINVVLYGLQGEIEVDGTSYNGVMNAWGNLNDEQVAAVLNHELTDWGNAELIESFEPIMPDEVAAQRDQGLSATDVHELRGELELP